MSGPDVEQTAEPGGGLARGDAVLPVEARTAIYDAMRGIKGPTEHALNMTEAHRVLLAIEPVVAALVAAAEERGFDRGVREAGSGPALVAVRAEAEWRGAEKERERIVSYLREFKSHEVVLTIADAIAGRAS